MIINVLNRQKIMRPDTRKLKALAGFFLEQIGVDINNLSEVTVLLTDDEGIQPLNRRFFDRAGATDVIAFLPAPHPAGTGRRAAEVVINIERAIQEGCRRGGLAHEFALYLAHGCDHLAGRDDRAAVQRNRMRRRELGWLRRAGAAGMLGGIFKPHQGRDASPRHPTFQNRTARLVLRSEGSLR